MEQEFNYIKEQGKDGAYVVPLDEVRSASFATKTFISGEYPGSAFWPVASGKYAYLHQAIITPLSGIYPIWLKFGDAATAASGNPAASIAHIYIASGQALGGQTYIVYDPALGPFQSGICIVSGGAQLGGLATAVIQTDPHTQQ
jgi:hypothetical protein